MANKTTTLGLTKPLKTEDYNVDDFNNNADKLDAFVKSTNTNIANLEVDIDNHSHVLSGTGIKGVLPVSKGGTGAATASVALQNLGLSGITKSCYVVAANDTDSSLKKLSNLKCVGNNDEVYIRTFIDSIPKGSIVYLLPGTYKFSAPLVLFKPITLVGSGAETKLININSGYIISITSSFVKIRDMQLIRNSPLMSSTSNKAMIELYNSSNDTITEAEIKSCLFDVAGMGNDQDCVIGVKNPISLKKIYQARILENTFFGKDYTGDMLDFSAVPNLSMVVGANISNSGIRIKVKSKNAVWTYGQATTIKEVE